MRKIQMVLHALPEELLSFVEEWLSKEELLAAVLRISPAFSVVQVRTVDELRSDVTRNGVPFRVCLARTPFDLNAANLHGFMTSNVMECTVDLGALSDEGLRESKISISPNDGGDRRFWSEAAKALKANTSAGLWAVSPMTGARKLFKNNRYTDGAAKLAKRGKKLLPLAGWSFFELSHGENA